MKIHFLHLRNLLCLLVPAVVFAIAIPAAAAADVFGPPSTIDYQGRLLDGAAAPLAPEGPANYEIQFRIYDEQSAGIIVWAEKQLATVSNGLFSVRLGEGDPILGVGAVEEGTVGHASPGLPGAFDGNQRYLGVTVVIPGQTPSEVTPRLAFLASPFSYVAGRAQSADRVVQDASSQPSSLNLASVSYVPLIVSTSTQLSDTNSGILADATAGAVEATLPVLAEKKEITVTKTDASTFPVTVVPPGGGGLINGSATPITLVNRGDSVTLRNTDANNWVIVGRYRGEGAVHADTPIEGGILARGGEPGVLGVNHNGYAFSGNGGDEDSGMFSPQDGKIAFFTNGVEKVYLDNNEFTTQANFTANSVASFNGTVNLAGVTTANNIVALALNDNLLKLRGAGDNNHFLSYKANFAGVNIDGPVISGASGGILGSVVGGEASTLLWKRSGGDGVVGINGNISNEAILRVNGQGANKSIGAYGFLAAGGAGTGGGTTANYGIWSDGRILCSEFNASSDERIKRVIGVSDSREDLDRLMALAITDYTFRDTVAEGNREQKKLIAQEVEKVYPLAVTKVTNFVPDIMKKAPLAEGWIQLKTDLKEGERVRLLADDHSAAVYDVLEVKADKFRTSFVATDKDKEVFVYGREVKDFRSLDYDAIAMLNVSASQQIKKDSDSAEEALRKENESLRARIAVLEAAKTANENRFAALEAAVLGKTESRTVAIKGESESTTTLVINK